MTMSTRKFLNQMRASESRLELGTKKLLSEFLMYRAQNQFCKEL